MVLYCQSADWPELEELAKLLDCCAELLLDAWPLPELEELPDCEHPAGVTPVPLQGLLVAVPPPEELVPTPQSMGIDWPFAG